MTLTASVTSALGVPCFTLRDSTERPVTVELGTNTILGARPERIAVIPALLGLLLARFGPSAMAGAVLLAAAAMLALGLVALGRPARPTAVVPASPHAD